MRRASRSSSPACWPAPGSDLGGADLGGPGKPDLTPFLGRRVRVVVDRPLGSVHPRHPDLVSPVNYGELPGTLSGDGHPIDTSLLGWSESLAEAEGRVAAVIVRADDVEDKLVVVHPGSEWTDAQIMKAVWFQERYFCVRLVR